MSSKQIDRFKSVYNQPADFPYDGQIVAIFPDVVHVRLAGAPRRILTNVITADHIDQSHLRIGMFVKLDGLYDRRELKGRSILTDILPNINYADYAGKGTGVPKPPIVSVSADCDSDSWQISWSGLSNVTYYQLYWSASSEGDAPVHIVDTISRSAEVEFDTASPPKIYFAVRGVSGLHEGDLSAWVTDFQYISSAPLIIFGDVENHGDLSPGGVYWKVYDGLIKRSEDRGQTWEDMTPDSLLNLWGDSPDPTIADVKFTQVIAEDDFVYVLGYWLDGAGARRGQVWVYDREEELWTGYSLRNNTETELHPIWMTINGTYLLVTAWADDTLILEELDITDISWSANYALGAATEAEFEAKTYIAYPATVPDDDLRWYVFGRMNEPQSLADPEHIILTDDAGSTWESFVNDWGTNYCASLVVEADDGGNREYWGAKI